MASTLTNSVPAKQDEDEPKRIYLRGEKGAGQFFTCDAADYGMLIKYEWYLLAGYARTTTEVDGKYRYAHHLVMQNVPHEPEQTEVDHRNRNRLDDTGGNLRWVTRLTNSRNISMRTDNTSEATGVCWDKRRQKWMVRVGAKFIGYYKTKTEAIEARRKAVQEMWGDDH